MFQENNNLLTIARYLNKEYPNSIQEGDVFRSFYSVAEEFNFLKNGIGLRVKLNPTILVMEGKDVLDFLHRVSTNSVKDLKPDEIINTLFLNEKGKIISRSTLLNLVDKFYLIGNSGQDTRLFSWLSKYIITEDIIIQDLSKQYTILELSGKQCNSFITLLVGDNDDSTESNKVRLVKQDGFSFYFLNEKKFNGSVCKILIEKEKCAEYLEYMFNMKSVFDLSVVGEDAYDYFRIENGIPAFPNEINDSTNPYEVNLIDEVSFKKGCYIGQEVITRLYTYDKVQRKLFNIILKEPLTEKPPLIVTDEAGNEMGELTTISSGKINHLHSGLALIKKKVLNERMRLFVDSNGKNIEIEVSEINYSK